MQHNDCKIIKNHYHNIYEFIVRTSSDFAMQPVDNFLGTDILRNSSSSAPETIPTYLQGSVSYFQIVTEMRTLFTLFFSEPIHPPPPGQNTK